jgi:hypothetical protein
MSKKRSVNYETGERLRPEMVTNVPLFSRFAQQKIGVDLPLGNGRRQGWFKYCKQEMLQQGWEIQDLVAAVEYIKRFNKPCRTPQGILWYVKDAREWASRVRSAELSENLHVKVAKALETELDDGWIRKLSLAQGKALEMVYQNWVIERGAA